MFLRYFIQTSIFVSLKSDIDTIALVKLGIYCILYYTTQHQNRLHKFNLGKNIPPVLNRSIKQAKYIVQVLTQVKSMTRIAQAILSI